MNKKVVLLFMLMLSVLFNVNAGNNNYHFKIDVIGEGKKSAILIPGFACSGEVWNETVSWLTPQYKCFVLTMPGFAGVPPGQPVTFDYWKEEIARFIITEKIIEPVIIGHSMGGGLALAIAAAYPDLISKIIIVDALPCLQALSNPAFNEDEEHNCSAMINQIVNASDEEFRTMQSKSVPSLTTDSSRYYLLIDWSVKSDRNTFAYMYCDFYNTDLREDTRFITCPALVLLEAPFKSVSAVMEEQYENLKTADIRYATKGLHFIMYDDPEWYHEQIENFLIKE